MCKTCKVEFCHCFKKKPHKHAELIKAWADGAEIEYLSLLEPVWVRTSNPAWYETTEYRIKPEPKPDSVIIQGHTFWTGSFLTDCTARWTIDVETGRIKSVELLDK